MPKTGDFSNCKIYKIVSLNNSNMVYYGHTCQTLSRRFSTHNTPSNKLSSKSIIDLGDAIILLVEEYPCNTIYEARAREAHFIINNECINKNMPGRSIQESKQRWINSNLDYQKKWRDANIDYHKNYRIVNAEKIKLNRINKKLLNH